LERIKLTAMTKRARKIISLSLALAMVLVPLAHSAAMELCEEGAPTYRHSQHNEQAVTGHSDGNHSHSHVDHGHDQSGPSDPCSLCKSHPVCHMVVIQSESPTLEHPPAPQFEAAVIPLAAALEFRPPERPPRS
jgi:hypothetical protein